MAIRPRPEQASPIARVIQAEAKRQNLTAYRLAKATGLRVDTTTRLLAGKGNPTLATLEVVAEALDLRLKLEPKLSQGGG